MKKLNNLSYGILNTVQNAIFPLITLPYVLQTLGPELYGKNLHAALFHQLFSFLFVLAINPYALRLFSHAIEDGNKAEEKIFNRVVSFQLLMCLAATAIQFTTILALGLTSLLYLIYTVITCLSFMNVEWFFQAKQDYKTIFFRTFIIRLFILCALFFFVKDETDFHIYSVIMAFGLILPSVTSFYLARRYLSFKLRFNFIKRDFLDAKYFYTNGAIGSVYSYLDQVFIGLLITGKELAILNIIKMLASAIMSVPNMVNRFIMPDAIRSYRGSNLLSHHKKYFTLMLLCLGIGLSLFYFFGLQMVSVFVGDKVKFEQSYILLIILSVFCSSHAVYIDVQSSVVLGLEKITTISNVLVAIISPVLAFSLFAKFGYLSPFIGFIIGEFAGVLAMIFMHIFVFKTNFVRVSG